MYSFRDGDYILSLQDANAGCQYSTSFALCFTIMDDDSLSQDEVDALLNAMSSEDSSASSDTSDPPKPFLSQEEMDTLLSAVSSVQPPGTGAVSGQARTAGRSANTVGMMSGARSATGEDKNIEVEKYDFTKPSRVSRDHVRALRALHASYARSLSSSLSMALRVVVVVDCIHIEQLAYGEYLASLLDPSCIGIFSVKPLKGVGIMEMNPPLVFPIIDRMLGGTGEAAFYNRALTSIEEIIIMNIMEDALLILQESWQRSIKLEMKLERLENNPQFVQAAAAGDSVLLILFSVRLNDVSSMMSICFPFLTIQQAFASLRAEEYPALADDEAKEMYRSSVYEHACNVSVTVSAQYESSQVTLRELLQLQKGDIIRLQNAQRDAALVLVGGKQKFHGRPGMANGRRAIQIDSFI